MIIEKPTYIYFDKRKNFTNALSCLSIIVRAVIVASR
jgi:hypothetical protein